jgi:hypothetical protein
VTATLLRASASLAHFLVVFVIIVVLYAFIGHNLLGAILEPFSTMSASVNSVLSMLTTDDESSFVAIRGQSVRDPLLDLPPHVFHPLDAAADQRAARHLARRVHHRLGVRLDDQPHLGRHFQPAPARNASFYAKGHRTVYAELRAVEENLRTDRRPRLQLGVALSLLKDRYELPSPIAWNIVLVFERRVNKDKVDKILLDRLNAIGGLNREIVARMRRTDGEQVKRISDASFARPV